MKKQTLSFTSTSMYLECGKKFDLHYNQKLRPKKTKSALLFGNALDAGLNTLLETKNLEHARNSFHDKWTSNQINGEWESLSESENVIYSKNDLDINLLEHFKSQGKEAWNSLYLKGMLMIEAYNEKVMPKIKKVVAVQKPIIIENSDGDKIKGTMDFIVEWEDGKIYLMDNKSSTVKYDSDSAKKSDQLRLYYYCEKENQKLDGVGFIVLNKNINLNKTKKCKECGMINKSSHKTCNNEYEIKNLIDLNARGPVQRCNGEFEITYNPEAEIDIILNTIDETDENKVIENFDKANKGIQNENFQENFNSCIGKFGPCVYYAKCHHNNSEGLVTLYKKEEK